VSPLPANVKTVRLPFCNKKQDRNELQNLNLLEGYGQSLAQHPAFHLAFQWVLRKDRLATLGTLVAMLIQVFEKHRSWLSERDDSNPTPDSSVARERGEFRSRAITDARLPHAFKICGFELSSQRRDGKRLSRPSAESMPDGFESEHHHLHRKRMLQSGMNALMDRVFHRTL